MFVDVCVCEVERDQFNCQLDVSCHKDAALEMSLAPDRRQE